MLFIFSHCLQGGLIPHPPVPQHPFRFDQCPASHQIPSFFSPFLRCCCILRFLLFSSPYHTEKNTVIDHHNSEAAMKSGTTVPVNMERYNSHIITPKKAHALNIEIRRSPPKWLCFASSPASCIPGLGGITGSGTLPADVSLSHPDSAASIRAAATIFLSSLLLRSGGLFEWMMPTPVSLSVSTSTTRGSLMASPSVLVPCMGRASARTRLSLPA